MKSLRSLAILAGGAVFVSAAYAIAMGDGSGDRGDFHFTMDDDDGRSMRHITRGDKSDFYLRDDNITLKAAWRGEFDLDGSGDYIRAVDDELKIEIEEDGVTQSATFKDDDDGLEVVYRRDEETQSAGEETDKAVRALVVKFLRASGVKANERVAALLNRGGAETVLAEFDRLEGDHAVRRYTTALVEQTDLTDAETLTLIEKIKTVESDHDLGGALEAILEQEEISPEAAKAILAAAQTIESDHDMRQIVEAFGERTLDDEALSLLIDLYTEIESDHDLRIAAQTVLENDALTPAQSARLLSTAADKISSDHDMRLILSDSAAFFSKAPEVADAWFEAYNTLSSSHDQRLALETIADAVETDPALRARYLSAARRIDSDHDRERALEAIGED